MITFSIDENEANIIIYNLLSERYIKLKESSRTRDEETFEKINYLMNLYKKKIELAETKRQLKEKGDYRG